MRLPNQGYINRTLNQAYSAHDTEIQFKLFDDTRPSNPYGERLGKSFSDPIAVKGYYESDPTALKLQDLGWSQDETEVLARVPFSLMVEVGLANADGTLIVKVGDRIITPNSGKEYEIHKTELREPYRNGVPTFVWIGGKKFVNGR